MVSSVKHVLALAVFAVLASTSYAIHCYQCESLSNPKCGEKFEADPSLLFDCSRLSAPRFLQNLVRNATGCMKQKIESATYQPQIIRTCYFGDLSHTEEGCKPDPSLPFVKQLSCDVCNKNECNGSSSLAPIAGAILMFFGVARLLA